MDITALNYRDTIERITYLRTQERVNMEFSPIHFAELPNMEIFVPRNEEWEKIAEAYQIGKKQIKTKKLETTDEWTKKYFKVRDFMISTLIKKESKDVSYK